MNILNQINLIFIYLIILSIVNQQVNDDRVNYQMMQKDNQLNIKIFNIFKYNFVMI